MAFMVTPVNPRVFFITGACCAIVNPLFEINEVIALLPVLTQKQKRPTHLFNALGVKALNLFDCRSMPHRDGRRAQQYGRRPQRLRVEGVLAQTHTPEESYCCETRLLLTSGTISKHFKRNNPQMGDFISNADRRLKNAQFPALLPHATCR